MSNANWKPWWEQVASYRNGNDQREFLRGVFQGMTTNRPAQATYVKGLIEGYKNRKFVQPESFKGKQGK